MSTPWRSFLLCFGMWWILSPLLHAQQEPLLGAGTRWNDSFREWILYGPDDIEIGAMELKFPVGNNWKEWRVNLRDQYGQVRQKWPDRADEWELRLGNEIVNMRTVYPGDMTEWRISQPGFQLTFHARYPNVREEWKLRDDRKGSFSVFTLWQGDLRQWGLEDRVEDQAMNDAMGLAMLFIALYHSTPKI